MRRWKECILAGLISCFLAVPCLSLANDEKIPEGAGGGAIALQTDGKSDLLQAVRAKDYDKALQIVNGQIEAHPGDADAYDRRSAIYALLGRYDQSLALLQEAVKSHPDDSRVYSERGLVYAKMGQDELAIADLTRALALKETAMDYNNRGECYRHLKQFDLAKRDYDQSIRLATDDDDKLAVYDSLGQLAIDQGDYRRAAQYLSQALAIKPYEDGYRLRSQVWRKLGDTKRADQDEAAAQEIEQRELLGS